MKIDLITVPYDSGHRGLRMGRGPLRFSERGAADRLRAVGHEVVESVIDVSVPFPLEVGTSFGLHRALSERVRAAVANGRWPLVLAGNCGSALGTVSGLVAATPDDGSAGGETGADTGDDAGADTLGVVWLDAHADFNTPETTTSGFLDGQMLAALTGRCWHVLATSIPGFRPVPDVNVVLVGARDLDSAEEAALRASQVTWVSASEMRVGSPSLDRALAALARRVAHVYVHIDLDVHDPAAARANEYAAPHGLSPVAVGDVVRQVAAHAPIAAAALTAYDPAYDAGDRMLECGLELMQHLATAVTRTRQGRP